MKIVYINARIYDFTTATLIEGLKGLGHAVLCCEASNYGVAVAPAVLLEEAPSADLVVLGSNLGVNIDLFARLRSERKVYVDGGDQQSVAVPQNIEVKAIFKRELNRAVPLEPDSPIFALPFAAEDRYFAADKPRKDIALSFLANMNTNPLRYSIHQRIGRLRHSAPILSGSTGESSYNGANGNPLSTPRYRDILLRSRIAINVPGAGYDCARYWEILAAGAMLMTWEPDIVIPEPFTDGLDCVTFCSVGEFDDKARYYLGHPDLVETIARRGSERLQAHHTSRARARYFLSTATAAIERYRASTLVAA
jgi:Glycosyl transferases group 1